jgi:nitrogen fixation NifU-like protein
MKSDNLDQLLAELQQQILEEMGQQYSATVIDHLVNPRNPGAIEDPDGHARITGPCGDTMEIFIRVREGTVTKASFLTDGCGTTVVSASMAVELATDRSVQEAAAVTQDLILERLGGLPEESRHCALLAADALRAAVADYRKTADQPWRRLYRRAAGGERGRR